MTQNKKEEIMTQDVVESVMSSISDDMQKKCLQELLRAAEEGAVLPVAYAAEKLECTRTQVYNLVRGIVASLTQEQRTSVYELL